MKEDVESALLDAQNNGQKVFRSSFLLKDKIELHSVVFVTAKFISMG